MVKVAVIGSGRLGAKIIVELASHGHDVQVFSFSSDLDEVLEREKYYFEHGGGKDIHAVTDKIVPMNCIIKTVVDADFIFDATPDALNIKRFMFQDLSKHAKYDAVIATSSLNLDVDEIFSQSYFQKRCLIVRFLFPVYCVKEVEVVPGAYTTLETMHKVRTFLRSMGKVAFLRFGNHPIILSPEQMEEKRYAFLHQEEQNKNSQWNLEDSVIDEVKPFIMDANYGYDSSGVGKCVACVSEDKNCVIDPCLHMCLCMRCGQQLFKTGNMCCPICRRSIQSIFRVFVS